jgi:hypothetical protein
VFRRHPEIGNAWQQLTKSCLASGELIAIRGKLMNNQVKDLIGSLSFSIEGVYVMNALRVVVCGALAAGFLLGAHSQCDAQGPGRTSPALGRPGAAPPAPGASLGVPGSPMSRSGAKAGAGAGAYQGAPGPSGQRSAGAYAARSRRGAQVGGRTAGAASSRVGARSSSQAAQRAYGSMYQKPTR